MALCHCGIDHHAAAAPAPRPVLILAILDESGSMGTKRADVIGGFNTFLKEQQAVVGQCRLTLVKFNTEKTVVFSALPLAAVAPLTEATYVPGGGTALLDAVAEGVRLADKDKQPTERVLCLVITDGEENSSHETTKEQVQAIIAEHEGRGDWTFTYLGAAAEKWAETGVVRHAQNVKGYNVQAPAQSFATMSSQTAAFRESGQAQVQNFYDDPTA